MEAKILAATSLLTKAIYLKQVLQFLVGDNGGLGNWQPGQGDDAFEVGLNECSIFLFTFGTWKSQTSVDPSTLDTTGNAKVMVLHRQNLNEGEPGRLEHQGIIEREA